MFRAARAQRIAMRLATRNFVLVAREAPLQLGKCDHVNFQLRNFQGESVGGWALGVVCVFQQSGQWRAPNARWIQRDRAAGTETGRGSERSSTRRGRWILSTMLPGGSAIIHR